MGTCSKPPFTESRPQNSWKVYNAGKHKKYRIFAFNTKIVQTITFTIEALAEGGQTHQETNLILNVTCPSYATVKKATYAENNRQFIDKVDLYIGGTDQYGAEYDFPSWYPSYEYCNFITGYALASEPPVGSNRNNSITGFTNFAQAKAPDGMSLVYGANHACDRIPCTK